MSGSGGVGNANGNKATATIASASGDAPIYWTRTICLAPRDADCDKRYVDGVTKHMKEGREVGDIASKVYIEAFEMNEVGLRRLREELGKTNQMNQVQVQAAKQPGKSAMKDKG